MSGVSTEARAREVLAEHMSSKHWGALIREGNDDNWDVIKPREAVAAMLAFAADAPPGWKGIESAPYDQEVIVRVYGMTFHAKLLADVSMDEDGQPCDQWQATRDGEYPPCWSEGGCWSSNENGDPSMQPDAWRPAAPTPEAAAEVGT
jgi:hypothetical protein